MMNTSADLLKELKIDRKSAAGREPPPSRRGWWIAVIATVVVLLVAGGLYALLSRKPAPEVRTASVVAISAGGSSASVLDASGYVVARRMATVSAKITGKVRDVMIEEGMSVKEGQVMATLDPIDADAARELSASQVGAARSQVENIRAQLKRAETDATRLETLVSQQLVSRSQYDETVALRDALRAQLQNAERNVKVAGNQLAISDLGVDNTVVRAPFSGVVTAKAAQPGEIVSPLATGGFTRTGIGTIVDMESLEVEVEVGEAYIGRVQPKMPVEVILNAYPDWKIPGEVIAIIPTADRGKATVKVRVAIKVKDPRIVPEMGVRVSFLEEAKPEQAQQPQGVRAPGAALFQRDGATVAFVVGEENKVSLHTLKTGIALGDDRQVLSGLTAGDTVVLDPPPELKDGDEVRIAGAEAQ